MHLHILGICGTFMGGLALLARAAGHRVTGCDANVYPPMSDQLAASGIVPIEIALPAMVGVHALIGIGEAFITVAALGFIGATRADLFRLRDAHVAVPGRS